MKSFKLREEKTFVKILKEPPKEQKKVNWSRRLYLLIFAVILFQVGSKMYRGHMVIFANGQIDLPKQTVNFSNDIQLMDLWVENGARVCKGDTLFMYKTVVDEINKEVERIQDPSEDWITRELLSFRRKIELNKVLIGNQKEQLTNLKNQVSINEKLLLSGVHDSYDVYQSLLRQVANMESEIMLKEQESKLFEQNIGSLMFQQAKSNRMHSEKFEVFEMIKYFTSPMDGVVSDIFYEPNEICYKKEELLSLHQLENPTINTYFDPNEIKYLQVGDPVQISFPDGSSQQGLINKFFVSTYAVPSEFQKKYEPTERNIVAEVVPLDLDDTKKWQNFYKMEVSISKPRYAFF